MKETKKQKQQKQKKMNDRYQHAFGVACAKGYLLAAKTLLNKALQQGLNPKHCLSGRDGREDAFLSACSHGQLHVVEWLLSTAEQMDICIDISVFSEYAFRMACANGHLNVAKYLLQKKPSIDITINQDNAFRVACSLRLIHIVEWLMTLQPARYSFEVKDGQWKPQVAKWFLKVEEREKREKEKEGEKREKEKEGEKKEKEKEGEKKKEEDQCCCICYYTYQVVDSNDKKLLESMCGHVFCEECLNRLHVLYEQCPKKMKCPCCRTQWSITENIVKCL